MIETLPCTFKMEATLAASTFNIPEAIRSATSSITFPLSPHNPKGSFAVALKLKYPLRGSIQVFK
jgi:hypothetical protein